MAQENLLERYTVVRELGRGAISAVHTARDQKTGATAALKTLDPALLDAADKKLAVLFLENARSAARLRHANIVQVLDAGEAGGVAYVLMELVEGKSLRELLDGKPLPTAQAIRIFDDIASALAYAHEEGMVHRGVRPSNIFVLPSGSAKIGDFGLGQIGEAAARYMSPEQVRGDPADHRTDLFSLGAVFYEMLTGRAPFAGHSPQEIKANILRSEPPRPSAVNPNVPAALDQMILGLLARRPEDRVASARLLLRDLQRLEQGLGLRLGATAPAPAPERKTEPTLDVPRLASHTEDFQRRQFPVMPDFDDNDARFTGRYRGPEPARRSGSPLATVALVVAVLSIGLTVFSNYLPALGDLRTLVSRSQEAPAKQAAALPPESVQPSVKPAPQPGPLPVAETIKPPEAAPRPLAPWPSQVAASEPVPAPAPAPRITPPPVAKPIPSVQEVQKEAQAEHLPAPQLPAPQLPAPKVEPPAKVAAVAPQPTAPVAQPTAVIKKAQSAGTAKLVIAVEPRGEIYIDGQHAGTTPPITTLDLEPGLHQIEIRNGSRRPYLTYVTVEPGDQRRIRHDFNAKIRPPA